MHKPTNLLLLLLLACTGKALAQGFFLDPGVGHSFAMPGQKRDQLGNSLNGTVYTGAGSSLLKLKTASFSSGMHFMLSGGYMFTKHIGVQLNADMDLLSPTYTYSTQHAIHTTTSQNYDYTATRRSVRPVTLLPAILLQTANKKWNVYMRMGLALPVTSRIKMHETYRYDTGSVRSYDWTIKNYFSLGFTAATGLKLKLNERTSIWGECSMMYLALARKERDLETATINGTTYGPAQLSGNTIVHYNKDGLTDQNGNEATFSQPYSNLSINIGISITFKRHQVTAVK